MPFPSLEVAQQRVERAWRLYRELSEMGDEDAAQEQRLVALTQEARAKLIKQQVYPASRPELPSQLRAISQTELAQNLEAALRDREQASARPASSARHEAIMTDNELFDKCMKPYGGRFDRSRVPAHSWDKSYGHLVDLAEGLIASARQLVPKLPPIHFDFVLNPAFNAWAFKAQDRYFIAFNTGTRYMLELIFGRMLSDTRLFDFVANPAAEDPNLPPFVYTTHAEDMYKAGIHPRRPKSDERWAYMCDLLRRAFFFLIGHELAHITLGHVDYLMSKTGNPFFSEFGWNMPAEENDLERQAMEIEADRRSVFSAMSSAKIIHELPIMENDPWKNGRRSVEDLLFDWSFSMNTLFRIFGDLRVAEGDVAASNYPPLPLRRFSAFFWASTFVRELWKPAEDANTIQNALKRGIVYTETAFMTIQNQQVGAKGLDVFGLPGLEYIQQIGQYVENSLMAKLSPFAYEHSQKQGTAPS
jgi:hypothetical protein